jgi:hypothetical protein
VRQSQLPLRRGGSDAIRIKEIVFDADHPASLARFWAAATIRDDADRHTVMLDPEGNQFCVQDP